jgi:PAS domain S-box-containing protein
MVNESIDRIGALDLAPRDVLEALLSSVPDAVYVVDPDGRVEFANPAALELLGYDEDELLGRISHPTIHHHRWDGSHFPEEECPMLRPRATGETVRVDGDCFWRKDGTKFRVAYSSAPLATARGRGAVVVFRDVTERMEAEKAARREAVERARAREIHDSRARIVAAADTERRRLGRDLHDGAQQRLVRVLLALRLAAAHRDGEDDMSRELLEHAAAEAEGAITALRELVNGVHPAILTTHGLGAAVESLATRLPVLTIADVTACRYDPRIEAAAYFVIAEALTNVVKHAAADEVSVRVDEDRTGLCIEIEDDGIGGADPDAGSGLRGLADRVAAFDRTLEIVSASGAGTCLRIVIPVRTIAAA